VHGAAELAADTGAGRPPNPDLPGLGVGVELARVLRASGRVSPRMELIAIRSSDRRCS
jgi:hypothetical protein